MEMTAAQTWYMFYGESIPSKEHAQENWDNDFRVTHNQMMSDVDFSDQTNLKEKLQTVVEFVRQSFQMSLEDDAPEFMPHVSYAYVSLLIVPMLEALDA